MATKAKRKTISKKLRFEVFKRDEFQCCYCGQTPPAVLLHIDHIYPVALGGTNDIDNLATACQDCNLGKGVRELSSVPQTMAEKAKAVKEREEQLLAYQAILQGRKDRISHEVWRVLGVLYPGVSQVKLDTFKSVERFVDKLGLFVVLDAAECSKLAMIPVSAEWRYFCAICWRKTRELGQ